MKSAFLRVATLGGLVWLAAGCSSDDSASASGASGQVTDAWRDYCVATFTKDTPILDGFDEVAFTARPGESYLLTKFDVEAGEPKVEIAYLTPLGPDGYQLSVTGGPETFPFTSNCAYNSTAEYYAAFTDVDVYDTEQLSHKICTIPGQTALPRDMTTSSGWTIAGNGLTLSGPETYDVMLNAFSSLCSGAQHGYVRVPETVVLGTHTWLVPIDIVLKPR